MENLCLTDIHLIYMNISLNTNQIQKWDYSHHENTPWPPTGHWSRRWPGLSWRLLKNCTYTPQHANHKLTKSPLRWWHRRLQWSWWSFLVGTGSRVICTVHNDSRLIKASSAATLLFSTRLGYHVVVAAVVAENAATHSRNDSKPKVLEKYHIRPEYISVTEFGALSKWSCFLQKNESYTHWQNS